MKITPEDSILRRFRFKDEATQNKVTKNWVRMETNPNRKTITDGESYKFITIDMNTGIVTAGGVHPGLSSMINLGYLIPLEGCDLSFMEKDECEEDELLDGEE